MGIQSGNEDLIALIRLAVLSAPTTFSALGGVTVNAYVEGRVQPADLVDADAQTIPLPALIVDVLGGGAGEYGGATARQPLHLYAYGKSSAEARALYQAAFTLLQGVRLVDPAAAISMAGYMRELERPVVAFNPTMKAYFARGTWNAATGG